MKATIKNERQLGRAAGERRTAARRVGGRAEGRVNGSPPDLRTSLTNGDLRRGKRSTRDEVDLIKHQRGSRHRYSINATVGNPPSVFSPIPISFFGILQTPISATLTVLPSHCSSVHCITFRGVYPPVPLSNWSNFTFLPLLPTSPSFPP